MKTPLLICPCGAPSALADCCGRYHTGPLHLLAPTAEALMRSRYSAYALDLSDYLLATWHRSTRPPFVNMVADETWLSLKVAASTTDGDTATVTFTARSLIKGRSQIMHEVSRFVRENGRWFYLRDDAR